LGVGKQNSLNVDGGLKKEAQKAMIEIFIKTANLDWMGKGKYFFALSGCFAGCYRLGVYFLPWWHEVRN